MKLTVYVVIDAKGAVRRNKRAQGSGLRIYTDPTTAQRNANNAGDAVVEVELDLMRKPTFIRGQKVVPEED